MAAGIKYPRARKETGIAQLFVSNKPIFMIGCYKGILNIQPVHILSVGPERVVIQAPDLAFCSTVKERVQLYSRAPREIFSARLLAVNPTMGRLELGDLSIVGRRWHDRQSDRVQPRDPIYVDWVYKKALIRACVENLSVGGMSLMIYKPQEKPAPYDRDSLMRLALQLPGIPARMHLKGKVLHERQLGRLRIVGIRLVTSSTQEKNLRRYVQARKAEILAELEQTSREFLTRQKTPGVYTEF